MTSFDRGKKKKNQQNEGWKRGPREQGLVPVAVPRPKKQISRLVSACHATARKGKDSMVPALTAASPACRMAASTKLRLCRCCCSARVSRVRTSGQGVATMSALCVDRLGNHDRRSRSAGDLCGVAASTGVRLTSEPSSRCPGGRKVGKPGNKGSFFLSFSMERARSTIPSQDVCRMAVRAGDTTSQNIGENSGVPARRAK